MNNTDFIVLKLNGIGYRAKIEESNLVMHIGYSHPITIKIPSQFKVVVPKPSQVVLIGGNGLKAFAREIQSYRKPKVYKGKGICLVGEKVYLKEPKN